MRPIAAPAALTNAVRIAAGPTATSHRRMPLPKLRPPNSSRGRSASTLPLESADSCARAGSARTAPDVLPVLTPSWPRLSPGPWQFAGLVRPTAWRCRRFLSVRLSVLLRLLCGDARGLLSDLLAVCSSATCPVCLACSLNWSATGPTRSSSILLLGMNMPARTPTAVAPIARPSGFSWHDAHCLLGALPHILGLRCCSSDSRTDFRDL